VCVHVIDTCGFLPFSETISLFVNVAERNHGVEEGGDDHIQPPGLINKRQTRVPVFRAPSSHGYGLRRTLAYKAITSGAHYFPRSVVISPYDKLANCCGQRIAAVPPHQDTGAVTSGLWPLLICHHNFQYLLEFHKGISVPCRGKGLCGYRHKASPNNQKERFIN
jgi:hypothetical protein